MHHDLDLLVSDLDLFLQLLYGLSFIEAGLVGGDHVTEALGLPLVLGALDSRVEAVDGLESVPVVLIEGAWLTAALAKKKLLTRLRRLNFSLRVC